MGASAILFGGLLLTVLTLLVVDGRQMCWSCQFVFGGRGEECAEAPGNWTEGNPRTRCEGYCVTLATFIADTGELKYFYRGCVVDKAKRKQGCVRVGTTDDCYFICGDGDHYCNDKSLPTSPYVEEGSDGNGASGIFIFGLTHTVHLFLAVLATHSLIKLCYSRSVV
ncbi:uncharacterized protein LOC101855983 [Aplysia californica]|uniref:Uncharacterized protein LOC101855983 n=1 Tax=Aplysia californica TaxID=6500 RepID=A0ABM0K729_APLCA|nr:uncharacterized protein LOC101855983 [Aplysia californica]